MSRSRIVCCLGLALAATVASAQEALRDPTRPLSYVGATTASGPELALQAIFQRASGAEAIVNGQSVRVGSTVEGARIESIDQHGVVYSYQGAKHTLRLRPKLRK